MKVNGLEIYEYLKYSQILTISQAIAESSTTKPIAYSAENSNTNISTYSEQLTS